MSTPAEILTALKTQLVANMDDVEQVLLGAREGITDYPTICLERESLNEEEFVYPVATLKMIAVIIILSKTEDKDRQLVGDDEVKGALDYENDVKLAIDEDRTLGGAAVHVEILDSVDDAVEFPVRRTYLRVSIMFRQTRAVRT